MDAVASTLLDDPVLGWIEELQQLAASTKNLAPAARAAVLAVIAAFELEDGLLTHPAGQARAVLAAAAVEPETPRVPPPRAETLLGTLKGRLHRAPSRRPAQTAA